MVQVLVVEDEALVAELVQDALIDAGLDVTVAPNGGAAMAALDREPRSWAVLVTDVNLGGGADGFEIARHARALNNSIKVVYMTGHAAYLAREGVPGALVFPKPFDPEELASQVLMLAS